MKNLILSVVCIPLSLALAGCVSAGGAGPTPGMSCDDLNVAIGETSRALSETAVFRGKVREYDLPSWLRGAGRAQDALAERNTRKIEDLQGRQRLLTAEYRRRCGDLAG